jgi:hypothetical protein
MTDTRAHKPITVYTRPGCPYCFLLRRGLQRRRLHFTEINIWTDPDGAAHVARCPRRRRLGCVGGDVAPSRQMCGARCRRLRAAGRRWLTRPASCAAVLPGALPADRDRRSGPASAPTVA